MSLGFLDLPEDGLDPVEASSRIARSITAAVDDLTERGIVAYLSVAGSDEEFEARLATKGCFDVISSVAEKHLDGDTEVLVEQLKAATTKEAVLNPGGGPNRFGICERCQYEEEPGTVVINGREVACPECGGAAGRVEQTEVVPGIGTAFFDDKTRVRTLTDGTRIDLQTGQPIRQRDEERRERVVDNTSPRPVRRLLIDEEEERRRVPASKIAYTPNEEGPVALGAQCVHVNKEGVRCKELATNEWGTCGNHQMVHASSSEGNSEEPLIVQWVKEFARMMPSAPESCANCGGKEFKPSAYGALFGIIPAQECVGCGLTEPRNPLDFRFGPDGKALMGAGEGASDVQEARVPVNYEDRPAAPNTVEAAADGASPTKKLCESCKVNWAEYGALCGNCIG